MTSVMEVTSAMEVTNAMEVTTCCLMLLKFITVVNDFFK